MLKFKTKHLLDLLLRKIAKIIAVRLIAIPHKDIKPSDNCNHVKISQKEGPKWISESNDPQILLKKRNRLSKTFTPGWYLLQIEITHEQNNYQTAKLYIDRGEGINENTALSFTLRPNKRTTRIFYLSQPHKHFRFDPTESKGTFTFVRLLMLKIPAFYAQKRMIERVVKIHPELINYQPNQVKQYIQFNSEEANCSHIDSLFETYQQTFSNFEGEQSYCHWIETVEKPKINKYLSTKLCHQLNPRISIILPLYNTNPEHLKHCIDSVLSQSYFNWQLCIVDDASAQTEHLNIIADAKKKYTNLHFKQREQNGHISTASNDALEMATGDFTLLLDHDDLLPPHTLMLMVDALNKHPEAKLIYADEDKIDHFGNRYQPHFKPDWNPDLLLNQNYIGHPVLYKTSLLKTIGGFRKGIEGSQDFDLLLRYTSLIKQTEIIHLPWILYHWRATENSTAQDTRAKSYTTQAGIQALKDHFDGIGIAVKTTQGQYPNTYKNEWPIPSPPPLVSLIIPTRDGYQILKTCIDSIVRQTNYPNYEIIIIDNQSQCTDTLRYLNNVTQTTDNIRVFSWDQPFNYSAINNFGVGQAKGQVIALVNNDIEVISSSWLTEMVSHAIRPEIGCVGAKLLYPNNTIQHAGVILGIGGVAGHSHKYYKENDPGYFSRLSLVQNMSAVTAACLVVDKSIFNEVNGLDAKNLTVAFNDVDFCLKVREAGYRNLWTPWALLYHHESISRGAEDNPQKQKRAQQEISFMKHKWHTQLHHDPAYNRNLTLTYENFAIRHS